MGELKTIACNGISWAIQELQQRYQAGEIKFVLIQFVQHDGDFYTLRAGEKDYLQSLGLLESAKANIIFNAREN